MPTCYQLIGVPGSGKSTWVQNQTWASDCVIVSTDNLVEQYAQSLGKTYNEVFKSYMPTAVELMAQQVVAAREQGVLQGLAGAWLLNRMLQNNEQPAPPPVTVAPPPPVYVYPSPPPQVYYRQPMCYNVPYYDQFGRLAYYRQICR